MSSSTTWRTLRAASLAAGLAALGVGPARANSSYGLFPDSEQLFQHLEADPRHIQLGAAYYRLKGQDTADAALGHSWGMARWYTNNDKLAWQWNVEGMALSRFKLGGSVNEFQTVDFLANLPLIVHAGRLSARAMLFHQSSHLGDDYIRSTGDQGFRYSVEGLNWVAAYEPQPWLRVYGGMTYLLHTVPAPQRRALQGGIELTSPELDRVSRKYPLHLFLAQDVQSHENVHWNVNSRTVAGVQVGFRGVPRSLRIYGGYFTGHSPYGQFYQRLEHYLDLGVSFLF